MPTAKENIRNGTIVGVLSGLFISALANGWLTVSANPIAGASIAQGYIFIIPAISTLITLTSLFTNRVKVGTKMGGFLLGFSGIAILVSLTVFTIPNIVNDLLINFPK